MPQYGHRDVQYADGRGIRAYLRDINVRIRELGGIVNVNRYGSIGQLSHRIAAGTTTEEFFIADESYEVTSVWYFGATAAGTVSLAINGTTVTGTLQTPPTSTTEYEATAANSMVAGDRLQLVTSATTGVVLACPVLRRLT